MQQVLTKTKPSLPNNLDILYVEDDMADAELLKHGFEEDTHTAYQLCHATTFGEALEQLKNQKFNAILLDLNLPDGKGLNGIDAIKEIDPNLPVVIITGLDDENTAAQALEKGAQEYVVKSHINNNIVRRVLQSSILRKQVENALSKKAYTDDLTGLPNKPAFEQAAEKMLQRAKRWKQKEALLFIDLNKFKEVNDTHGHEAGNIVLQETAKRLTETLRTSDLIARYAGDEFVCYLDSNRRIPITQELCHAVAQKIVRAVEKPISIGQHDVSISLSIGVAIFPDAGEDFETLMANADAAMYEAKNNDQQKICFVDAKEKKETSNNVKEWMEIIQVKPSSNDDVDIAPSRQHNDQKFSEFAFMAAHDLRAPVRKIVTFSELLEMQYDDLKPEEIRHFVNRMHKSGIRMNKLIDDLLLYARILRNNEKLEQICLTDIVDGILEDMSEVLKLLDVRFNIGELPKLLIYRTQVRQIFAHLISNAIKYKNPDQQLCIEIGYEMNQNNYVVYVRDNGIGIDAAYLADIFKPFKRLHSADEIEGTGLGLVVCQKAIERHGGHIWAEQAEDNGSIFKFSFPRQRKD